MVIDTMAAVGVIMECTAAPSFAELVMADVVSMALWGALCVLLVGLVYVYRGSLRKWLD